MQMPGRNYIASNNSYRYGFGHTAKWNKTVLEQNGGYLDFLTQHYYVNAKVRDGKIENPNSTLFAPAKMEAHLKILGTELSTINAKLGRTSNPIRLSVDEWNNRHSVFNGTEYKFSRQSIRKQFDVAVTAGMLNAFIRQSPAVGMANYIFPVNGHGLIRTVGNDDAFVTPLFYLFKQYRERMTGSRVDVDVTGPGIIAADAKITIAGDCGEVNLGNDLLPFVDAAGVMAADQSIHVSLINRSTLENQDVTFQIPTGYKLSKIWTMYSSDINAFNAADNRYLLRPRIHDISKNSSKTKQKITIPPCGVAVITFDQLR